MERLLTKGLRDSRTWKLGGKLAEYVLLFEFVNNFSFQLKHTIFFLDWYYISKLV